MGRRILQVLLVATAASLPTGCVDDDGPSFFVSGFSTPDDECVFSPSNPLLLRGTLNAQLGSSYTVYPILNNQLRNRGAEAPLRADPNGVLVTGAEIELRDAAGEPLNLGALPNPFTVPTSDFVPSTQDIQAPAQQPGAIQVIPRAYTAALDTMLGDDPCAQMVVVISVKMFGETTGDIEVEASEWLWPVDVCQGDCLLACGISADDLDTPSCFFGQDQLLPAPSGSELFATYCAAGSPNRCMR